MHLLSFFLMLMVGLRAAGAAEVDGGKPENGHAGGEALRVMIAVPLRSGQRVIDRAGCFQVVVENTSIKRLTLWTGRENRGFANLKFEITDADGKVTLAQRAPLPPGSESDSSVRLEPGECYVLTVFPESAEWQGFPAARTVPDSVKMRAVFDNSGLVVGDSQAWVGRVFSAENTYTFSD